MMAVYEKRGWWKVSGESKKYKTKEEALAAASDHFVVVEAEPEPEPAPEPEVKLDPFEALRQARIKRDGDIEEGSDNGSHNEE